MDDHNSWAPNSEQFEFEDQEIHVWRAYLDCDELGLRRFDETLAPDEKARANRFVFRQDRNRYVAARGALRELLGRYLDRSPAAIEFDYTTKGKPSLRAALNERSIQPEFRS